MKCPKCGTEIREGYLYCDECGEEIHIVPDFEPEIEYSIHKTLSGIVEEVLEEVPAEGAQDDGSTVGRRKRLIIWGASLAVFLVCVAALVLAVLGRYRHNSVSYQIAKAATCMNEGNTQEAIVHYERAVELKQDNVSYRFMLADLYLQADMGEEYINALTAVIELGYAVEREEETAYKKMISYYKDREDYVSINALLMGMDNETIRTAYQSYMAAVPEFSYKEGTYAEVIPLKLTASTQGTIYYTMDGSIPDESSEVYTTPVFLETGSYEITAIFVNQYGIKSEAVAKTYVIDVQKPAAPEVETYSGEYAAPTMIRVTYPTEGTVYYTTDGTIPTDQAAPYTGPIPMPLGKSIFKFVTYNEEGVAGECTTRQFELELKTEFTTDIAVNGLIEKMVEAGKLTDASGTIAGELSGRYLYAFQYAAAIEAQGDFYVIAEIYEDTAGVQNRTGTVYAVNIYTQEYYKLSKDALDAYVLEAI